MPAKSSSVTHFVALAFQEAEQRAFDQQNPHLPPHLHKPLPAPEFPTRPVRFMFNAYGKLISRPL